MKTVMIVDDASTVRMFHKMLVTSPGRIIEEAENGVEALEKAIGTNVDLFLVDVNMPKMDGYRLCKEIRLNEALRAVPIIMISTESANQDAERAYQCGANYYMTKPVDADTLKSVVSAVIGGEANE
ncbi:response regulator [Alteromonas macleodii]|uniref:response regulator n=1 Tax=Alteromonas macleodii TaxID=28108 RepID=UPI002FE2AB6C